MAKKQKKVKLNKRLLNAKMQKKFSLGFGPVIAGVSITAMIAMAGIILLCINMAKNGLPITLGIVVIVVLLIVEMLTIFLCKTVSSSLADSIVVPIFELKDAVNKLKAGDFDIDITYDKKKKEYMLGIETAYMFKTHAAECDYLRKCLDAFTKYMDNNGLEKNKPYMLFMSNPCTSMVAETIEELYVNFKIFVDGFCNQDIDMEEMRN